MTEQQATEAAEATVEARQEAVGQRSYWELAGDPARAEIVYVDSEGKTRFPDTPLYKYPSAGQGRRVRAGKRVYDGEEIEATDAALRKAEELGVDLADVEGTGADGNILVEDVGRAAEGGEHAETAPPVSLEVEEDEAAFWQLVNGAVVYYDSKGGFHRPEDEEYAGPHEDVLERLEEGERVYVDEG